MSGKDFSADCNTGPAIHKNAAAKALVTNLKKTVQQRAKVSEKKLKG